jgi:threonine-phosphate decarboxylase
MPSPFCHCQCKMCRVPGVRHCSAHPSCGVPVVHSQQAPRRVDERSVGRALGRLKAASGTHSPSVSDIERALPGVVQIDACFLSNPYATTEVMKRLRAISAQRLEQMVCHYPSQAAGTAALLASYVGIGADHILAANGACEAIHALLADAPGPLLLSLPTFSAYYEFAAGPLITHQLRPQDEFRLDLSRLEALVARHAPETVVIITPNNPDGGLVDRSALIEFVRRVQGRVRQVIVDESFSHFGSEATPQTLTPLVRELEHLVVVNSLSKSHGIAGLRLGYAVANPARIRELRGSSLWNLNAFAEWFCGLLNDPGYLDAYERARLRYHRTTQQLFAALHELPGVTAFPSAANFALLELDRPAGDVAGALLARHGVYTRDCADKRGLSSDHYLRIAARSQPENDRILTALHDVLAAPQPTRTHRRIPQPAAA